MRRRLSLINTLVADGVELGGRAARGSSRGYLRGVLFVGGYAGAGVHWNVPQDIAEMMARQAGFGRCLSPKFLREFIASESSLARSGGPACRSFPLKMASCVPCCGYGSSPPS